MLFPCVSCSFCHFCCTLPYFPDAIFLSLQDSITEQNNLNFLWTGFNRLFDPGTCLFTHWQAQFTNHCTHNGKQYQNLNKELPYDPAILLVGVFPKEISISKRYLHPYVNCSIIHDSQDMETTLASISKWMDKEEQVGTCVYIYDYIYIYIKSYYLFTYEWLISLSIMSSEFIHVAEFLIYYFLLLIWLSSWHFNHFLNRNFLNLF